MSFVSDPSISKKIRKMSERVRWQDPLIVERGIDQTQMVLDDPGRQDADFSFMVLGDSGSGSHRGHHPQRRIAERMLEHQPDCRFVLHTGDVVYLVGASDFYRQNFIEPYREFLVGGKQGKAISYNQMVFEMPFLPVPGNHDYYDLPWLYGALGLISFPLRKLLSSHLDFDVGFRGSEQGKVYAKAFLDYLVAIDDRGELERYLDQHYVAQTNTGRCLHYQPGQFTRLPNRYYAFQYGGIDFFALDSNTFNAPSPLPYTPEGREFRRELEDRRLKFEQQKQDIMERSAQLNPNQPDDAEQLDDLKTKLEQLDELQIDIDKQLEAKETVIDIDQLNWLKRRLIESWYAEGSRGRVIFFHHPPYVTEATKWHQAQTMAVRHRLRWVLGEVASEVGDLANGRPLVDLVLNGHAHCLEYLTTHDTGFADSKMNWIVCGGSGYSLRRQRSEGVDLPEIQRGGIDRTVARSHLFVGRTGQGSHKRRPYSFLRIDVQDGKPPKFVIRPYVSERYHQHWHDYALEPFTIGGRF